MCTFREVNFRVFSRSYYDLPQLGVQARPWLNRLPRPQMVLEREDIRTDEEKERDLLREAEALTGSLFADTFAAVAVAVEPETPPESDEGGESELPLEPPVKSQPSQAEAYLELVQIVKEYALTLWIDEAYRERFYIQLPLAILNAQAAGLTAAEITAAMQVGDSNGRQEKAKTADTLPSPVEQGKGILPAAEGGTELQTTKIEGYRVRARRERVRLRRRTY